MLILEKGSGTQGQRAVLFDRRSSFSYLLVRGASEKIASRIKIYVCFGAGIDCPSANYDHKFD